MNPPDSFSERLVTKGIGEEIFALAAKIYPICRSITGNGVRSTLRELGAHVGFEVHEVPTGTRVFDWTIPREWNIHDAYIKDARGQKIVDFARSNLHVVSYSVPIRRKVSLVELRKHVHTLPAKPDVIPYRTSYYVEDWGFCMSHNLLESLRDEFYEVVIDATLADGSLTYGEHLHQGEIEDEFLLSAHICHPSLANENCSGLALLTYLAKRLASVKTRYSYRFVFAPGTIGAITWLARNQDRVRHIKHGLIVSIVGDGGGPTYKKSRRGNAYIDRAVAHVLRHSGMNPQIIDFSPYGYDERQYCSPGFNLPVGLFQRSMFGAFPQYHNSGDDLDFISADHLADSYRLIATIIEVVENDARYHNTIPKCEPQLGRRGLYDSSDSVEAKSNNLAVLWMLNMSDGEHSVLDIAERANIPFAILNDAARILEKGGLIEKVCPRRLSDGAVTETRTPETTASSYARRQQTHTHALRHADNA
jgi:aminopeptidase-like protein